MTRLARVSASLPAFPWDTIADARETATRHGLCNFSVGTPVDPTPEIVQEALRRAADAHGYPTTWGTERLRESIIGYMTRRWASCPLDDHQVLPVVGTKELVAWLATQLGLGGEDLVVIPTTAYPTYEVGATLAGCRIQRCDDPDEVEGRPSLIWINSPANPHGAIADPKLLCRWVEFARSTDALLASDECYGEFGWEAEPRSILDAEICGGEATGLLVVNSLSKRSNMAGYRAGYVVGDAEVTTELLEIRKQSGMMVPAPIQAAMVAALDDDDHVIEQRARYMRRRDALRGAFTSAGFTVDDSQGSLYLWVSQGINGRDSVSWLAERGILAAPGDFYGPSGADHVRVAFTAIDEHVDRAVERLGA